MSTRRQRVKKTAEHRRNRLEDCRKYMLYLQDVMEAEAWIRDKLQLAKDESYHDPVNLDNKKKKHTEFEAEVNANEQRIQNIAQVHQETSRLELVITSFNRLVKVLLNLVTMHLMKLRVRWKSCSNIWPSCKQPLRKKQMVSKRLFHFSSSREKLMQS